LIDLMGPCWNNRVTMMFLPTGEPKEQITYTIFRTFRIDGFF
jgi:hypothetical protein